MKKIILTFVISFFTIASSNAQLDAFQAGGVNVTNVAATFANHDLNQQLINVSSVIFNENPDGTVNVNFSKFKGSPYEKNTFSMGSVTNTQENKSINLHIRYNIYNDEIELRANYSDKKTIALIKEKYFSCTVNGKSYYYESFTKKSGAEEKGYLSLLYAGENYSLYKRLTSEFTLKPKNENLSASNPLPPIFKTKKSYYIKYNDVITFLPTKKKLLINKFSSQSKSLKTYMKKSKTNLRKDEGLIGLVKFLDTSK